MHDDFDFGDFIQTIGGVYLLLLILACFLLSGLERSRTLPCDTSHVETERYALISATDDATIYGNLHSSGSVLHYVTNATIENRQVYRFFYQSSDGGIHQEELPIDNVTIYYTEDGESPYFEVVSTFGCGGYYKDI